MWTTQQRLTEPVPDEHETLGQRLRRLRRATGCTVSEIAAAAGIKPVLIYGYERDWGMPSEQTLEALARVYGVGLDELVPTTPATGGAWEGARDEPTCDG